MSSLQRGTWWAVLFGVLFAVVELLGAALEASYPVHQIVWMRYGVHLSILLVALDRHRLEQVLGTAHMRQHILRSLSMLAMPLSWVWAAARGADPMTLAAGVSATPVLAALIARMRNGNSINAGTWACAILSAAGGALLALPLVSFRATAILPLVPALCLAFYIVETHRLRSEPAHVNLFHTAFWVFLCLTPVQARGWIWPTVHDWSIMIAIGAVGLLALLALDHAAREAGFVALSSFANLPVFITVGLGAFHHGAMPAGPVMAGLLLLGGAAALSWRTCVHNPRRAPR